MAMKTAEFDAFGIKYRTTQFSAVQGLSLVGKMFSVHPIYALEKTQVYIDGKWEPLNAYNINLYVKDEANNLPPIWVLNSLLNLVSGANFGFLDEWKRIQIPNRFLSNSEPISASGIEPVISSLVQEDLATLRELEEYYSLQDAFNLFDVMMAKTVNKLLGQEEAEREAKNRSR